MKRRLILISMSVLVILIGAGVAVPKLALAYESWRGGRQARNDVSIGHFEIQTGGLPGPAYREFVRLLNERYGVSYKNFGCVSTETQETYRRSYNQVMEEALWKKYGKDIFAECDAEAQKIWSAKRSAATLKP